MYLKNVELIERLTEHFANQSLNDTEPTTMEETKVEPTQEVSNENVESDQLNEPQDDIKNTKDEQNTLEASPEKFEIVTTTDTTTKSTPKTQETKDSAVITAVNQTVNEELNLYPTLSKEDEDNQLDQIASEVGDVAVAAELDNLPTNGNGVAEKLEFFEQLNKPDLTKGIIHSYLTKMLKEKLILLHELLVLRGRMTVLEKYWKGTYIIKLNMTKCSTPKAPVESCKKPRLISEPVSRPPAGIFSKTPKVIKARSTFQPIATSTPIKQGPCPLPEDNPIKEFSFRHAPPAGTIVKQPFDLQASLKKPITWKPHKGIYPSIRITIGPLKPFAMKETQ
ncbi:hypothetical protein HDV02_004518 [Globomyces sp. JEL0801]|nr:hypothetical protein HDV02_004518 [Globomyces sp. JEL0801]